MSDVVTFEPDIKKLRAIARQRFDYPDKDNHDPLETPTGVSMTGRVDLLVLEAEMIADGRELGNPHIPADTDTLVEAQKRITENGHTPAWTQ